MPPDPEKPKSQPQLKLSPELEKLKEELGQDVVRIEMIRYWGDKDALSLPDFFRKYQKLLEQDFDSWDRSLALIPHIKNDDDQYIKNLLDIGEKYHSADYRNYTFTVFLHFTPVTPEAFESSKAIKDWCEKVVNNAINAFEQDPTILTDLVHDMVRAEIFYFIPRLTQAIKPIHIQDAHFSELAKLYSIAHEHGVTKTEETAEKIMLQSKEQDFKNIVDFKKTALALIESGNKLLIDLVLRRGKNLMEQDSQTKEEIRKALQEANSPLE